MTKYILHGGKTSLKSADNKKFFQEIVKDLVSPINLLIVYFARVESEWQKLLKQDKENFISANPGKVINFVLANKNKDIFINQIKEANAIYMRGGETIMLVNALKNIKNLKELFKDKVVAGSSAGAYVLSRYYIDSKDRLGKGLGILPIKSFAHYNDTRKDELNRLKNHNEKLSTYALEEGKFVVIKLPNLPNLPSVARFTRDERG